MSMNRILPDGLTGSIMAVEGISDATVMLHGPGGCRMRHMMLSMTVFERPMDSIDYTEPYFFGYSRVPSTYLDEYDFINGAYYKSKEGLEAVSKKDANLIVVIDSPGAGLIGDDHTKAIIENGLEGFTMHVDESFASVPAPQCCGQTLRNIMEFLGAERTCCNKGTVTLLGISLMDKDWEAARDELTGYIESLGLKVVCCPGFGSNVNEMIESVNSEYAVIVCPEMCTGLSDWYQEQGVKIIRSPAGAPVGLDALETWINTIAAATETDAEPVLTRITEARAFIRKRLNGMRYNSAKIRGLRFSIAGVASVIRPLTEWLYDYLTMVPVAVATDYGSDILEEERLRGFLEDRDFDDAFGKEPVPCDVVLCEGIAASTMLYNRECSIGIPIGYSTMGLDDVIPRPVYGIQGAMYMLDEILHGVRLT